MIFDDAVNELRVLLSESDAPAEFIDCAFRLIQRPQEALFIKPVDGSTLSAPGATVSFEASNRLFNFLTAARTREWEKIIIAEMKHDAPQHTLVHAKV